MRIATAEDAAAVLAPFFVAAEREQVAVLHLAADRTLIAVTHEQTGDAAEVALPIRSILASALRLGAEAIVVAHNHPSGDPAPSAADREATRRLADALQMIAIRLVDHIVFAGADSRSMAALGLL